MYRWTKAFAIATAGLMALAPLARPAAAQDTDDDGPRIRIGMDAVSVWQAISLDRDGGGMPELEPGFQAALGTLHLSAEPADGIQVYAEVYMSSKHHPGYLMDREGYLFIDHLPEQWVGDGALARFFDYVDIKGGHFEVDFGNLHYFRSDGAQVQNNPLIGNYVVDPNTVEAGGELIGHFGPLQALVGFGSGITTEDFQPGTGYSLHGKLSLQPGRTVYEAPIALSASVYRSDQSETPTGYPKTGTYTELFAGNRSGARYSGPFLYPRAGVDPDFGQIKPGAGQDVTAWQVDGLINIDPLFAMAAYGWTKDADVNGFDATDPATENAPEDEWTYYSAEARWNLLPSLYAAARYSGAQAKTIMGQASEGSVGRIQVGVGYRLIDQMLMKVEYVRQTYSDFADSSLYGGNLNFSGIVAEGSVSF